MGDEGDLDAHRRIPTLPAPHSQDDPMTDLHPLCAAFPRASDKDMAEIVDNMRRHGFDPAHPIVLLDGKILDGRNREEAARIAGVKPIYAPFAGDDPMVFVIRVNIARRQLKESQKGMVAARLAEATVGRPKGNPLSDRGFSKKTREKAAKELNTDYGNVDAARTILNNAAPHIIAMVDKGEVAASTARVAITGVDKEEQALLKTARDVKDEAMKRRAPRNGAHGAKRARGYHGRKIAPITSKLRQQAQPHVCPKCKTPRFEYMKKELLPIIQELRTLAHPSHIVRFNPLGVDAQATRLENLLNAWDNSLAVPGVVTSSAALGEAEVTTRTGD